MIRNTRWLLAFSLLFSCSSSNEVVSQEGPQASPAEVFSEQTQSIVFEMDYGKGAQPSLSPVRGKVFSLLKANLERMFKKHPKSISVPNSTESMEALDVDGEEFTKDAILAIAEHHRDKRATQGTATFYVVWLPGYFHDGTTRRTDVLGAAMGTSGVIAMFRPVIDSVGDEARLSAQNNRFAAETTLIHEFAHAVGMVNSGVPPVLPHQDEANGHHCSNVDCVLHFSNESVDNLKEFVTRVVKDKGDTVIFDDACLSDMDTFAR